MIEKCDAKRSKSKLLVSFCVLATSLLPGTAAADGPAPTMVGVCAAGTTPMDRVDLFFGASGRPSAWRHFLSQVVTPKFPDGLTTLEANGQWRGSHGLEREATRILIIFYRRSADSDARIDKIRSLYKIRFRQVSVLRADSKACVGF